MGERVDYRDRIVVDPEIMVGKPVVRGTRIPVMLVVERLVENPDLDELLEAFPRLTAQDVEACLEYAEELFGGGTADPTDA